MGAMIIDPVSPEECGVLFSVLTASRTKQSAKHGKSTRFQIELISTLYHACGYYFIDSQGNSKIGLEEAIDIIQKVAEVR